MIQLNYTEKMTKNKKTHAVVAMYVSQEQKEAIQEAAKREHRTVSNFAYLAVLDRVSRVMEETITE